MQEVMKRLIPLVILLAIAYLGSLQSSSKPAQHGDVARPVGDSDQVLASAFENRLRNVQVQGIGQVARVLADDNDGSRHQKFILRLASGQKLLVAHNIDLAERAAELRIGDTVEFRGEYEWNPQGGVIHWTHRDPEGRHATGWLKLNGRTYQ
jgi:hypothetical protein